MFRTAPLSIVRSLVLYTQQWCVWHTGLLTACELTSRQQCLFDKCLLLELLMMDGMTVRNM